MEEIQQSDIKQSDQIKAKAILATIAARAIAKMTPEHAKQVSQKEKGGRIEFINSKKKNSKQKSKITLGSLIYKFKMELFIGALLANMYLTVNVMEKIAGFIYDYFYLNDQDPLVVFWVTCSVYILAIPIFLLPWYIAKLVYRDLTKNINKAPN